MSDRPPPVRAKKIGPAFGWLAGRPLLLASGSETRRDMLQAGGIPVEVVMPDVDERAVEATLREGGAPAALRARVLARAKAAQVAAAHPGRIVLAADQTLSAPGHPGTKAASPAEARRLLALLAGRAHTLHSAAAIAVSGEVVAECMEDAVLMLRPLSAAFIAGYVEALGDRALSSVGGYQIEAEGAQLMHSVEGDHATILGLPLRKVLSALRDLGALA